MLLRINVWLRTVNTVLVQYCVANDTLILKGIEIQMAKLQKECKNVSNHWYIVVKFYYSCATSIFIRKYQCYATFKHFYNLTTLSSYRDSQKSPLKGPVLHMTILQKVDKLSKQWYFICISVFNALSINYWCTAIIKKRGHYKTFPEVAF